MNVTGIILCGGKSSRMGKNKALLEIGEERLIDRTVKTFRGIFREIILVTNSPLEYLDQDAQIVSDIIPEIGPVGGIYTGLFYASSDRIFVAPCDMPFLSAPFIEYMIRCSEKQDIVVPSTLSGFQPLHAVYSRNCMPKLKKMIKAGQLKVSSLYRDCKTREIREETVKDFDPEMKLFFNVNSPEDFSRIS